MCQPVPKGAIASAGVALPALEQEWKWAFLCSLRKGGGAGPERGIPGGSGLRGGLLGLSSGVTIPTPAWNNATEN